MSRSSRPTALPWLATLSAEDLRQLFVRARPRQARPERIRLRSEDPDLRRSERPKP